MAWTAARRGFIGSAGKDPLRLAWWGHAILAVGWAFVAVVLALTSVASLKDHGRLLAYTLAVTSMLQAVILVARCRRRSLPSADDRRKLAIQLKTSEGIVVIGSLALGAALLGLSPRPALQLLFAVGCYFAVTLTALAQENATRPAGDDPRRRTNPSSPWYARLLVLISVVVVIGLTGVSVVAAGADLAGWTPPADRQAQTEENNEAKDETPGNGMGGRAVSGSAASSSGAATSRPPTYDELCREGVTPGFGAPDEAARKIHDVFLGRNGVGALIAGCAEPATSVKGHPEVWRAVGRCRGVLRSLAVAAPGQPPALLLQQAAVFAERLAEEGRLLWASPRTRAGTGDFHIVMTPDGAYVLIRRDSAAGTGTGTGTAPLTSCGDLANQNVRYAVLPPSLVRLWMATIEEGWLWPRADDSGPGDDQRFTFESTPGSREAEASCDASGRCVMTAGGVTRAEVNGQGLTVAELAQHAPPVQAAAPR